MFEFTDLYVVKFQFVKYLLTLNAGLYVENYDFAYLYVAVTVLC